MKRLVLLPLWLLILVMSVACSKTEPKAAGTVASSDAKPVDYEKICGRLIELAPAERKETFRTECVSNYKAYLPACSNADAVTECFVNLKSWNERLGCVDNCKGNPKLTRPANPADAASGAPAAAPATPAIPSVPAAPAAPAAPAPAK